MGDGTAGPAASKGICPSRESEKNDDHLGADVEGGDGPVATDGEGDDHTDEMGVTGGDAMEAAARVGFDAADLLTALCDVGMPGALSFMLWHLASFRLQSRLGLAGLSNVVQ